VSLTRDESKAAFAVIRHNVRTYVSGGVVAVVKGKDHAESTLGEFLRGQSSEDRHAGWRYFLEKTDLTPGMNPEEATNLRQTRLEIRESKHSLDAGTSFSIPPLKG
jgi:hypothetical protein